jgi:hypothetical protein
MMGKDSTQVIFNASGAANTEAHGYSHEVRLQIWSWAVREVSYWLAQRHDLSGLRERLAALNETDPSAYLLRVERGTVTLVDKPALALAKSSEYNRAAQYRDFIQTVVAVHCPNLAVDLIVDTSDARGKNDTVPVFVFQKPPQCNEILLPDVDFLGHDFYDVDDIWRGELSFSDKRCHAIFVGSTTGAPLSSGATAELSLPRVRAAIHFRQSEDVSFLLPKIVQCNDPESERILRGLGFGSGQVVTWHEQLRNKFVISMDGNGATCSRVVIALKSNSVLLKYDSPHALFYFPGLRPWTHYIPIGCNDDIQSVIDTERRYPGIFSHIAEAGRRFAETYLTRQSIMLYTAWVLQLYQMATDDAGKARATFTDFVARPEDRIPFSRATPLRLEIVAHIQDIGDRRTDLNGWTGVPGSGKGIEGFSIGTGYAIERSDIECTVLMGDGSTVVVGAGEFAGTRGRAIPLTGFRLRLIGSAASRYVGSYEATFVDGSRSGPLAFGAICSTERNTPLEAIRISLVDITKFSEPLRSDPAPERAASAM